jgi:hypothetical protein
VLHPNIPVEQNEVNADVGSHSAKGIANTL